MGAISLRGPALPALFLLLSGFTTPPSGPAVVPYECGEGRPALVLYESGNDFLHAKARVTYDGRTTEMSAAPTLYGVRYRSETNEGAPLAWTLRGEQALLTESPDEESYTREERLIARCTRVRSGGEAAGHSEDHGPGHEEGAHLL